MTKTPDHVRGPWSTADQFQNLAYILGAFAKHFPAVTEVSTWSVADTKFQRRRGFKKRSL